MELNDGSLRFRAGISSYESSPSGSTTSEGPPGCTTVSTFDSEDHIQKGMYRGRLGHRELGGRPPRGRSFSALNGQGQVCGLCWTY